MARLPKDISGMQFYQLYPQTIVGVRPNGDRVWKCFCVCDDSKCEKELEVRERYLLDGKKKSCNKGRRNNCLFTPTIEADEYTAPTRSYCIKCHKNTPHTNGICSWHTKEVE